jgi:hypothetical protein
MPTISRTELHHLIDELPEPVLPEIAQFVKFIQFKLDEPNLPETYTPIALGGLWQGLTITDEAIVTVRQEMWAKFGDVTE